MKFMFNKNKKGLVYVDLEEYGNLERRKIDNNLRIYEQNASLTIDRKEFESLRELKTTNDYAIDESRRKFLASKDSLNQEILKLKEESQELEIKNKLSNERKKLNEDELNQGIRLKNVEIELLKSNHAEAVKDKNEIIELLKTQLEVLTAKLTEIKISDAHIHVETVAAKK